MGLVGLVSGRNEEEMGGLKDNDGIFFLLAFSLSSNHGFVDPTMEDNGLCQAVLSCRNPSVFQELSPTLALSGLGAKKQAPSCHFLLVF